MRAILIILIMLAAGLGVFYVAMGKNNTPEKPAVMETYVVVALRDLPVGTVIVPATDLQWKQWPKDGLLPSFIATPPNSPTFKLDPYQNWHVTKLIPAGYPVPIDSISKDAPITDVAEEKKDEPEVIEDPGKIVFDGMEAGHFLLEDSDNVDIVFYRPINLITESQGTPGSATLSSSAVSETGSEESTVPVDDLTAGLPPVEDATSATPRWVRMETLVRNAKIETEKNPASPLKVNVFTILDPLLKEKVQIARAVGFIRLVPRGTVNYDGAARICTNGRCFEYGSLPQKSQLNSLGGVPVPPDVSQSLTPGQGGQPIPVPPRPNPAAAAPAPTATGVAK